MKKFDLTHLKNFLRNSIIPYAFPHINKEGWKFVAAFALITALLALLWEPLGVIGIVLTVWCYFFFRDPERVTPQIDNVVVSPADGKVQMITKINGPKELGMEKEEYTRVSIFMSVFNVHVNRAPANGTITKTSYIKGKFFNATLDKASKDNERQLLAMKTDCGKDIAFVQIAGLVARRILCFAKKGTVYKAGERFGLIRFGSRLDVYLPEGVEPQVCLGQTMIAGETIIANLTSSAPQTMGESR
ncbi:MAG: phosphatidylserine decarboxylase [Alphaproteobacteria bacterium]|nr:phosphatidylserine decarboxylase [Alphaproteobacteria bacterium]